MEREGLRSLYCDIKMAEDCAEQLCRLNDISRETARFLCSVTQGKKFSAVLSEILYLSAQNRPGFSGKRASALFSKLEAMALNLLLYPWRLQEYALIEKWGSFYRYELEECFEKCDQLIKMIGYRESGEEFLLDKDKTPAVSTLRNAAFDFFAAAIECGLIESIRHRLGSVSWMDVVSARHEVVGDEQVCMKYIRQHQKSPPLSNHQLGFDAADLSPAELKDVRDLMEEFDYFFPRPISTKPIKIPVEFEDKPSKSDSRLSGGAARHDYYSMRNGILPLEKTVVQEKNLNLQRPITYGMPPSKNVTKSSRISGSRHLGQSAEKRECPSCRMWVLGSRPLCAYCNHYFT